MDATPTRVLEMAANLDDVTGEVVGDAIEALLAAGALDAWAAPIVMKKGRPGVCLHLLCDPSDRDRIARRVIELTGSFGVRFAPAERLVVERRIEPVDTPFGSVRVKLGDLEGQAVTAKVEFDDARRLAAEHGVAVRRVIDAAHRALAEGSP